MVNNVCTKHAVKIIIIIDSWQRSLYDDDDEEVYTKSTDWGQQITIIIFS